MCKHINIHLFLLAGPLRLALIVPMCIHGPAHFPNLCVACIELQLTTHVSLCIYVFIHLFIYVIYIRLFIYSYLHVAHVQFCSIHSQHGPPWWAAQCMGVQLHLLSTLLALGNFSTSAGTSPSASAQCHWMSLATVPRLPRCQVLQDEKVVVKGRHVDRREAGEVALLRFWYVLILWPVSTFQNTKQRKERLPSCSSVLDGARNLRKQQLWTVLPTQRIVALNFKPCYIHMMTTNKQLVGQPFSQIQGLENENLCSAKKICRTSCILYLLLCSWSSGLVSPNMTTAIPNCNRTAICKCSMSSSAFPTAQGFFPHTAWRARSAQQTSP